MTTELDTTGKITIDGSGSATDDGELNLTTFDGQTVSSGDAVVALTYYGDANLDRTVNSTDYDLIGSVSEPYTSDGGYADGYGGWSNGDFIYNGAVNSADGALLTSTSGVLALLAAGVAQGSGTVSSGSTGTATIQNVPVIATSLTVTGVKFSPASGSGYTTITPTAANSPVLTGGGALTPVPPSSATVGVSVAATVNSGTYILTCRSAGGQIDVVITVP